MPAEKIISESEVSTFRSNKFMVKFGIIQSVTELNLVIDPQLKFAKHLKKISKTIQSNGNCFKLIRNFIPNQAALLYMHAMVFSHIS